MTTEREPCTVCGRACYRALPGGRWRVEWQVGDNLPEQQVVAGDVTECRAAAQAPSSPLPRSFKRLVEVLDGSERVWMHVEARDLAAMRIALLQDTYEALSASEALLSAPKIWTRLIRSHRAYLREMGSSLLSQSILALEPPLLEYQAAIIDLATRHAARPPGGQEDSTIAEMYREARSTERRLREQLFGVAGLIAAEAQALATGWLRPEPELGRAFDAIARACALHSRSSRRRRTVTLMRRQRMRRGRSK